ncbi:MAG TPA: ATP-binding protein [Lacunisphaera sp.]|nr:ATP-binding protein [Lacunisphaera sp.]
MPLRNTPIRQKLMLILLVTSAVVMLLMRGAFFAYEYVIFRQTTLRHLATLGEILAANSTAALAFENPDDAAEILSALKAERHVLAAALFDRQGRVFARYAPAAPADPIPASPGPDGYRFVGAHLVGFQAVMVQERRLGTLFLRFDSGTILREFMWGSLPIVLGVMALVLLAAYLLSRVLQRQISTPILALAESARAVSERRDYTARAPALGRDELGLLTEAFNQMLGQIHDLTRDLEQRVAQRTTELEAANKELEAFSYSVSHDLRAPLRHIDGFAGMLVKSDGAKLSTKGQGYLGHISASAKQMGALIDDLLVFSRMGRTEMQFASVDLQQLTEETIKGLELETQQRNIRWKKGELPVVPGDLPMLRQVFVNLLSNAVKYTRPRDPAEIEIGCQPGSPEEIVIFIRDNGVGFDMKYATKLFGVFQRMHRSEDFEGTGIGLANVRRIVLRHGGRIWAESAPEAGATFYFTLPRQRKSPS